jgi:hypothetical protein
MKQYKAICTLLIMFCAVDSASGQLIRGDENFPVINELRWGETMSEVRILCEGRQPGVSSTDSVIILQLPVLGFAARTELQFDQKTKSLKQIQAKFKEPSKALADSITSYLIRILGRGPVRTVKEKSLLIFTVRLEMATWNSPTGLVNLVTATKGESLFDASLVFFPPTVQQTSGGAK